MQMPSSIEEQQRWKNRQNKKRLEGHLITGPKWQHDVPTFFDHSMIHYINRMACCKGFNDPFEYCETPATANNGEVFLSDYLLQQTERTKSQVLTNDNQQCMCMDCTVNSVESPAEKQLALPVPAEMQRKQMRADNTSKKVFAATHRQPSTCVSPMMPLPPVFVKAATLDKYYCMQFLPYRCEEYTQYIHQKQQGEKVLGRPPHSHWCLKACAAAPI